MLNCRSLANINKDPLDMNVLTPIHLPLLKEKVLLPPGIFSIKDNYAKRRWRQVQYLADVF